MGYSTVVLVNNDHVRQIAHEGGLAHELAAAVVQAEHPIGPAGLFVRSAADRPAIGEVVASHHNSVAHLLLWQGDTLSVLGKGTTADASSEGVIAAALRSLPLDADQRKMIAASLNDQTLSGPEAHQSAVTLFDLARLAPTSYEVIDGESIPWQRFRVTVDLPIRRGAMRVVLEESSTTTGILQVGFESPFVLDDNFRFTTLWPDGYSTHIGHSFDLASWADDDRILIAERVVEWLMQRLNDDPHMAARPQQTVWNMLAVMGSIVMALGPEQGAQIEVWPDTLGAGQGQARPAQAIVKPRGNGGYDHRIDGLLRLVLDAYRPSGADLEIVDGRIRPKHHPARHTVMPLLTGERGTARRSLITTLADLLGINEATAASLLNGDGMPFAGS